MLNKQQLDILEKHNLLLSDELAQELFISLQNNKVTTTDEKILVNWLTVCNTLYRAGFPCVPDHFYDHHLIETLSAINPDHPYLHSVEPELEDMGGKVIALPKKMLSTDKAYDKDTIDRWLTRITNAGKEIHIEKRDILIRVSPKLDGFACYDDGEKMYTRGNGTKGTDITRIIERGVMVVGNQRGLGPGEIVVSKTYFDQNLSEEFDNSRNFQSSVIKEKELSASVQKAVHDKAVVFYPFASLPCWTGSIDEFNNSFEDIVHQVWHSMDYDVDGIVIETTDAAIQEYMGSTSHHNRWQIAYKKNDEEAFVEIRDVTPQTAKTGRITPVAELVPTLISGAILSRATAHHYGRVKEWGIGKGAIAAVVRSGLVIPKLERMEKSVEPVIPTHCPSCQSPVEWQKDNLYCTNKIDCPAQIEGSLEYFFKTLGNIDGFGEKTMEKLREYGVQRVSEIYAMTAEQFQSLGLGDKQSQNLIDALEKSRSVPVEDWRFLAAFSIPGVGRGGCERLLKHHKLTSVFDLSIAQVIEIADFAEKTATTLVNTLKVIKPEFDILYGLGFNLTETPLLSERALLNNLITGKTIVFTGTMLQGKREDMEKQAKSMGAKVGSSVSSKTDYLVIGEKVGLTKINDAQKHGVKVITENDYLNIINTL